MTKIVIIKKPLIHLLVWLTYAIVMFNWISSGWWDFEQSVWLTLRTISIHAFIFYINAYLLLPRLMEKNRYVLYVLSIIGLIILVYLFKDLLNDYLPVQRPKNLPVQGENIMRPPRLKGFSGHRSMFSFNFRTIMDIIISVAILFISTTFWMTIQGRKRQQAQVSLQNENLSTELKLLKSQINPHFLFNALNNIYSLSFTHEKKAPELIMKLSEMLRYVLYESNDSKVTLDKEIEYIHNYIDFQKIKIEENADISFEINIENKSLRLEPMLFIPFIENSFKHSNIENKAGWIKIDLFSENSRISFEISNSKPEHKYSQDTTSGIGLENVKKRLELLYPKQHNLSIEDKVDSFTVKLILQV